MKRYNPNKGLVPCVIGVGVMIVIMFLIALGSPKPERITKQQNQSAR